IGAIEKKGSPICVGIDPIIASMPDAVFRGGRDKADGGDPQASIDAIFEFTTRVLKIVAPHVPCVKFQSAYFEQYHWEGVEAYFKDVKVADGRTWSEMVAERLASVAEGMVGARGWSSLGAVVGATQTHTMISLRQRLPKSIFLLPGYGTQGATAEMTRHAFRDGLGALVSASRSILYAHKEAK